MILLIAQSLHIKRVPRTNSKALKSFSSIASFVFHPLIIVTYLAVALYKIGAGGFSLIGESKFLEWLGIIFLSTVFVPFLAIFLLRKTGLISDAFMHAPRDRVLPLIATLICYSWAFYFFEEKDPAPLLLRSLLLGAIFSVILDFAINFFYKVSVHTTAAGMMPGNILALMIITPSTPVSILVIAILPAILVGLVRWWLGAHTKGQIFLGYAIGIAMQLLAWLILK